jgi:cyclopropane-fatty-acyl-phospholipid synthase
MHAVSRLFRQCDITIDGGRPTDVQVHDRRFYSRALSSGSLGLGESYVDRWWDAADLDGFLCRVLSLRLDEYVRSWRDVVAYFASVAINLQRPSRAYRVGQVHYDVGNDL